MTRSYFSLIAALSFALLSAGCVIEPLPPPAPVYRGGYAIPPNEIYVPTVLIVEGGVVHDHAYYVRHPDIYRRDRMRYPHRFVAPPPPRPPYRPPYQPPYRPDYHHPDYPRPDYHRPDNYRPDNHRPDNYRPDNHRPDNHRPDNHRPDNHRPDNFRPDNQRPNPSFKPGNPPPGNPRPDAPHRGDRPKKKPAPDQPDTPTPR